jgi:glutamate N-acetyltransferase/amino-acid N-acetyltransferase
VAGEHLAAASPRLLLINAGYANAGTGEQGLRDARHSCQALAELTGLTAAEVLPFSTGVIGERLPLDRLLGALPDALKSLSPGGWEAAARAIMTTDTRPKIRSVRTRLSGSSVTVTGMAKGAGMICPDMATMLAFVTTDARIDRRLLQACLDEAVAESFNAISVDGDTSTNDACVLSATGLAANPEICVSTDESYGRLREALVGVCAGLAEDIVRDGEGATRLLRIRVSGGRDRAECRTVAYTVAHSPLVKTALFAGDPNWGRFLAAVGRAGLAELDVGRVSIHLDDVCVVQAGCRAPGYREEDGQRAMAGADITLRIELGRGSADSTLLTCDLSHDYVTINAEYRT